MKLYYLMKKPLDEILHECEVLSIKPIADEKGNIIKIIVEYASPDNKSQH
ncbi:MAG: hypothetical protein NC320_01860 [Clostridium sp.]|nr:hypothetical protein [Clostridium sp.]